MNYEEAASFWTEKDKHAAKIPADELRIVIENFIKARSTCALAVADGDFIRCTPLTYKYRAGKFVIFSEGGLKFRALKQNKHTALAIYEEYKEPGSAKSLQVTGIAKVSALTIRTIQSSSRASASTPPIWQSSVSHLSSSHRRYLSTLTRH